MGDRYRKVRRALRVFQAAVKNIEKTYPNRAARRQAFYNSQKMKDLVEKIKEAKRNA
jgi:hypothetical protein